MKPRKLPFVLITVLTLCLGAIAFVSMNYSKWVGTPPSMQETPEGPVGESKQAPSKEQIAKEVSTSAAAAKTAPMGPESPEMLGGPGATGQPSIYRPKPKPYRPQPNDSSIASGWYNENYGGAGSK